jgi:trigger factor
MQVTETISDGLKREFKVVVPADELDNRLVERLTSLKDQVRIKGFRPGKVPVNHLRKLYGKSAMAEIVQNVIGEVTRKTLDERGERAATPPSYDLPTADGQTDEILSGNADLAYTMSYEILPKVTLGNFKTIHVDRPIVEIDEADVESQLQLIAENSRTFEPRDGKAEDGDRLTIAYVGSVEGERFEGGSDENAILRLGSNRFIPGFEEQLVGVAAGETRTITVTFPDDYGAADLAGKTASFEVTVKEVAAPGDLELDDELAGRLGLESIDKLRDAIRDQLRGQYNEAARMKVKRQILDQLDEIHSFDLPEKMVDTEFDNIWRQVTAEMAQKQTTFEDEGTTEEAAQADYRKIAERRVRLGLVLSEIGEKNQIEVRDDEVQRALAAQLRQFPGQEDALLNYYRNDPDALGALRAPIFEEKVVDFLLELVDVTDKPVTKEELLEDGDHDHHDHDHEHEHEHEHEHKSETTTANS